MLSDRPLHTRPNSFDLRSTSSLPQLCCLLHVDRHHHLPMSLSRPVVCSFSPDELRALPQDVLVHHIIPQLANAAALRDDLDTWADRIRAWVSTHRTQHITQLHNYHPTCNMTGRLWIVGDHPVRCYTVFGPLDIPFTVYRDLACLETGHGISPFEEWDRDRGLRAAVAEGVAAAKQREQSMQG